MSVGEDVLDLDVVGGECVERGAGAEGFEGVRGRVGGRVFRFGREGEGEFEEVGAEVSEEKLKVLDGRRG